MKRPWRAAVIGAGAIGARLDAKGLPQPLTHAGGYVAAGFELVGVADSDRTALEDARRWDCPVYSDVGAMMVEQRPDVISISVPAEPRPGLIEQVLSFHPKVIVAEKPLATTGVGAAKVVDACRSAGVPLVVNYSRRFIPFWQKLQGETAISMTIKYAKGIRHNGTHAIDLCHMLFGQCLSAKPLAKKADYWPADPTVSAYLQFERCQEVFLESLDERCFTLFEVDIVAETWRLTVHSDDRRARRYELQDHVGTPPGKRLVEIGEELTDGGLAMLNLMRNVADMLKGGDPLCTGEDAVAAQEIAERLSQ